MYRSKRTAPRPYPEGTKRIALRERVGGFTVTIVGDNASNAQPAGAGANVPAASAVVTQLHRRFSQKRDAPDQRSAERFPWVTKVTLEIQDPIGNPRILDVVTHDISVGGFSFVYRQFLHQGTTIRVFFDSLSNRPELHGIVKSCVHIGGMHHRIGVRFSAPGEDE